VRVLGPVEIDYDGRRVEVLGVARAVLALLTRSAGQVVSVESIVDGLWGSRPPAGAERAVASYVSRLRKALAKAAVDAAPVVLTRVPGYVLAVDPADVDLTEFESRVAEGRRAAAIGQPARAAVRLRHALALWRGDAYADVAEAAFAPVEARRLAELRLAAIELRVEAELAAAAPVAPPTLASELRLLITEHPHRERLWTYLITSLYRQGQQADALATYQLARERLVEDLGLEPGNELRAAELAVLAGDPNLTGRPTLASLVPPELPGPVPGCVGRDEELAFLESALDDAATTRGQARVLVGGPGYGKTRLVAELAHRAARQGVVIRYGRESAALEALVAEPDRLTLVILDDLDRAGDAAVARVAAWARASRTRPVLTVVTGTDPKSFSELSAEPRLDLTPLTDRAVAGAISPAANGSSADGVGSLPDATFHSSTATANQRVPRQPYEPIRDQVACPYKGLAAFEAGDAEFFHGRERLVAELVARMVQGRLLAVVGASGSGKSSIVRAGLLPALSAGVLPGSAAWPQVLITPAGTRDLAAKLGSNADGGTRLLFVDQFEEVFTALDEGHREAFLETLVAAVDDGVVVVLALRSDFYGRCADHVELASLVTANTVLIRPMAADELRRAVERPAVLAGLLLEDGLVDRLVDDVRGASGGLPLLSTSLLSLWERRSGRTLSLAAYREVGGVAGAVEQLGERAYASLATPELRDGARRMLLRLADAGGEHAVMRRRATRAELEAVGGALAPSILDCLAERRLITVTGDQRAGANELRPREQTESSREPESVVEVAHEALLTQWTRLRDWLADDAAGREMRAHLTPAADAWGKSGDPGDLYRGARLAAAQEWATSHTDGLTEIELEFIDASSAAVMREQLSARRTVARLRQTLAAAAVALAVAISGVFVAVAQQRRADTAAAEADARRLAAQALVERDLGRAMLYGVAATRLFDSPETRASLVAALNRAPGLLHTASLADGDRYQGMTISPSGTTVAVGSVRGVIQMYDAQSLRLVKTLIYPKAHSIEDVAFTPDGRYLLAFGDIASSSSPGAVVWDLITSKPVGAPFGPATPLAGRPLADGDSVAIHTGSPGSVEIWSLSRRERVRVLDLAGSVATMTVSRDRRSIVLGGVAETAIVDGLTGAVQRRISVPQGRNVSPDGSLVLVADGFDVSVWDVASATQRGLARQHTGAVLAMAWSADGRSFATTSDDRSTIVWDAATLRPIEVFSGPPGRQVEVGFSADGRSLYTAGHDGCVYLWDLTGTRREETLLDPAGPYAGGRIDPQMAMAVFDPVRNRAIVAEGDLAYHVNVTTGKPIGAPFNLGAALHQWPDLSADGGRVAIGLADGRGRVWDVASRRLLLDIQVAQPDNQDVWSYVNAGLSGDGRTVAFAAYLLPPVDRTEITFYDVDSGRRVGPIWQFEATTNRFGASPDGRYLVATTAAGFAAVWDLHQHREVARLQQPARGSAMLARFSRDGRYLAVGNGTGRPTLWRVRDWSLAWQAESGHNGSDIAVSFSPDGSVLASSGSDSKIFLYDVDSGNLLGEALGPNRDSWLYAEFLSDHTEIVGYFDDGSMSRWDVDPQSQIRTACQIAGRELSQAEWDRLVPGRPYQPICPQ
jgi:WD40 repeat protein/DNA-binding SARP family transcriptional activator